MYVRIGLSKEKYTMKFNTKTQYIFIFMFTFVYIYYIFIFHILRFLTLYICACFYIFLIRVQQHPHLQGFREAFTNLSSVSSHIATIQQGRAVVSVLHCIVEEYTSKKNQKEKKTIPLQLQKGMMFFLRGEHYLRVSISFTYYAKANVN